MKLIAICKKCSGTGTMKSYGLLVKKCNICKGSGKTIVKVKDTNKAIQKNWN